MKLFKLSVVSVFSALLALPISISFAAKTTYTSTQSTGKKGEAVTTSTLKTYTKKGTANSTTKTSGMGTTHTQMNQVGKTSQKNYKGGSASGGWVVKDGQKVRQSYTVKKDNGNAIKVTTKNPVTQKIIYPKGRQVMLSTGDKKVVRIKKGNTGVKITKEGSNVTVKKGTLPQKPNKVSKSQ